MVGAYFLPVDLGTAVLRALPVGFPSAGPAVSSTTGRFSRQEDKLNMLHGPVKSCATPVESNPTEDSTSKAACPIHAKRVAVAFPVREQYAATCLLSLEANRSRTGRDFVLWHTNLKMSLRNM